MTDEQFAALVHRLEARARSRPTAYGRQVLGLAMLGNLYLALTVLLITALLVAAIVSIKFLRAVGVKLALVIGVFLWTVLKSLWVKLPAPQGREVKRAEAPELFAMLDELRSALGAPRFHRVLLSDDFNAAVTQVPRLGIFGWPRNYLLLGLPLMKVLSREQFKAVLAHEYGHLAGGHARLSNWIYRQRQRWGKLLDALSEYQGYGSFLFLPFLRWYTPYFNAFSFPLARANEYEADAASARLTSAEALATALASVAVAGTYLSERYWPAVHEQAQDSPQPGFLPYAALSTRLVSDFPAAPVETWLSTALERETTLADTHPALAERVAALGVTARITPIQREDTADQLLGAQLADITAEFDRQWHDAVAPAWAAHHAEVQERRAQLATLNARHDAGEELSLQDAFERAALTGGIGRDEAAALLQWQALLERAPQEGVVRLRYGSALARTDSAAGMALLEQAMADDASLTIEACRELRDLAWAAGDKAAAGAWHQRMVERQMLEHAAAVERDNITARDNFEPHALDAGTLATMQDTLRAIPSLKGVWLVRKRCAHLGERPLFVLGYTVGGWPESRRRKRAQAVLAAIQASLQFAGETVIVNIQAGHRGLARPLKRIKDAKLV